MKIKFKILFLLAIFFYAFYLQVKPAFFYQEKSNETIIEDKAVLVSVMRSNETVVLPLEEYLIGVVASEMPATFEMEALKAQAVAARTFVSARLYQVDDTTSSQVYRSDVELAEKWQDKFDEYHQKISRAVKDTEGKILTYQGEVITAAFFSSSNGMTNNASDYWQSNSPYLLSVDSSWEDIDIRSVFYTWEELSILLQMPVYAVSIISYYPNRYVESVSVNEEFFSGRQVREQCQLASSSFTIEQNNEGITFITQGSGHGIGMSQYGAQKMAMNGSSYEEILYHYYSGVEIVDLVYN